MKIYQLSTDLKWRIVFLHIDGYSDQIIANMLCLSISTVRRILNLYKTWGCVETPIKGQQGRRKIFDKKDLESLKQLVTQNPDFYLDELVVEMTKKSGKEVSVATLCHSLKYCGITRKKITKAAKERNELVRGFFILTIGSYYSPEQLIFLDESSKDERSISCSYGYSFRNQPINQKVVFIRGKRFTILPALTLEGYIALDIMEGNCTKERFRSFILAQIVNSLPLMNPYPQKNSVLVMDNAVIHHDDEMIQLMK
ncbi:17689_t:CDS:2 [Entrophospora sp. SA101]|nr:10500_t:CDS:2 [Entrophospora sp. SA101]CAJ0754001.1 17689_t:CDS:2 [Entrophospora sp. SA101]CAJ0828025.1 18042_t:CDS:2 [Entrophospora sp. SA101]CAJ0842419.1 13646_t:CDS:2 [Entrophospora sp. SA101]